MTVNNENCVSRNPSVLSLKSIWKQPLILILRTLLSVALAAPVAAEVRTSETQDIAEEGYIYGFPILLMDETRDAFTGESRSCDLSADINTFHHVYQLPDTEFRAVVRPNVDTLYSAAMLDLSDGPMLLDMPAVADRYVLMALLDAWSNNFAGLGTQSHGTGEGHYFITGPEWSGTTPVGYTRVKAPTDFVWIIGRTEVWADEDLTDVNSLQDRFVINLYRSRGNERTRFKCEDRSEPEEVVKKLSGEEFFTRLDMLMREYPLAGQDQEMIEKLARINVGPLAQSKVKALSFEQKRDLDKGREAAQSRIDKAIVAMGRGSAWSPSPNRVPLGEYGEDYFVRAVVAQVGFGANRGEFAVYENATRDSDSDLLSSDSTYTLTFAPGEEPDVGAFWSVTVYNPDGFLSTNEPSEALGFTRYAVGSNTGLQYEDDGSLIIYMSANPPEGVSLSNWLPVPEGNFEATLRMYDPASEILSGDWQPPKIVRTGSAY
ncbi:MAG: hypothetical protein CMI00_15060 [Oceanospirillaceae bacterium]|nr:hypothetical protein [Oceanospirillaceae bacterium]|tara:strand:+ start:345 stop:1811 length:1467 start_codon:yes stop_codon:yes gene_type:complete